MTSPRRLRAILLQLALVAVVVALVIGASYTIESSLKKQQIASGFGYLGTEAGFDISESLIPYSSNMTYGRAILVGMLNTLKAAFVAVIGATVLGCVLGLARLSKNFVLSRLALGLVESIRNVPLLLQLIFWYAIVVNAFPAPRSALSLGSIFFLSNRGMFLPAVQVGSWLELSAVIACVLFAVGLTLTMRRQRPELATPATSMLVCVSVVLCGLYWGGSLTTLDAPRLNGFNFSGGMSFSPELTALVLGLTIYVATFIAEIVRAGVLSVPRAQLEAARSLGLKPSLSMRLVVFPQAMRLIIPPLTNTYLSLAKSTSLGVAIGYPDLTSVTGTAINQSGQAVEGVLIQLAAYLALSLVVSFAINQYERRTAFIRG